MSTPKTILIVEDDEVARQGLAAILRTEGYATLVAADGKEGMDYCRRQPRPDLILLDMLMGEYDGWYFLRGWKADPTLLGIPVVIMTVGVTTREWAESHGCAGFVQKPINVNELLAEVLRLLPTEEVAKARPAQP
jgi:two-component system phosphate regulon response regulator PhoB